jgi:hypothetical protein
MASFDVVWSRNRRDTIAILGYMAERCANVGRVNKGPLKVRRPPKADGYPRWA